MVSAFCVVAGDAEGVGAARSAGPAPSLSLRNNSNEVEGEVNRLQGAHKRTAHKLTLDIKALAKRYGIERLAFMTLSVPDPIAPSVSEVLRRFNSFLTGALRHRFPAGVRVVERGERGGRVHLHCVVVCKEDVQTGINWAEVMNQDLPPRLRYRSASPALKEHWAWLRETGPRYGFGRIETLPVRSTAEGIAFYVGGYIKKGISKRIDADKGCRMVSTWGDWGGVKNSSRFGWGTPRGWAYRMKLGQIQREMGCATAEAMEDKMRRAMGPRWRYGAQSTVLGTVLQGEVECYTRQHAIAAGFAPPAEVSFPCVVKSTHYGIGHFKRLRYVDDSGETVNLASRGPRSWPPPSSPPLPDPGEEDARHEETRRRGLAMRAWVLDQGGRMGQCYVNGLSAVGAPF